LSIAISTRFASVRKCASFQGGGKQATRADVHTRLANREWLPESMVEMSETTQTLPLRDVRLGSLAVAAEWRPDGSIVLSNKQPLGEYARRITDHLMHWAAKTPVYLSS
jgi:hypothetical protein